MARHFCRLGMRVIATGRKQEKLDQLSLEFGDRLESMAIDLSEVQNVERLFDFCREQNWKLDGIVHCAGITMNLPLRASSISATEDIVRINFESLVEITRLASSKRYTKEGAAIVAMSSTASITGGKGLSLYSATKAAVNLFVKSAAMELSSRKIRINAIAPMFVETPMYYQTVEEIPGIDVAIAGSQPFGLIQPKSVAELAEFLLSEKAKYITGSVIIMNAGAAV